MNMKALIEKRNSLVEEVNALFAKAETEVRALSEEENAKYDELTAEIRSIDSTMAKMNEEFKAMELPTEERKGPAVPEVPKEEQELRSFETYLREMRAENMAIGSNGAVIPTTIANRIIDTVKQIAPLYAMSTKFSVKGELQFPVVDQTKAISVGFADEFTELTSSAVAFKSTKLNGFLAGALSVISNSLINNAQFDIVSHVVAKMSESIAKFIENSILNGADSKTQGILANNTNTASNIASVEVSAVDYENLIDVKDTVPQQNQAGCVWVVGQKGLNAMHKVKDGDGKYMLINGQSGEYTMLGHRVYVTDAIADETMIYGDFSAVYVNVHEDVNIQILKEKYATQHATGVVAWFEMDNAVIEPQKMVVAKKQ